MKILILASLLGASAIGGVAAAQEAAPLPPPPAGEMGPMHHGHRFGMGRGQPRAQ